MLYSCSEVDNHSKTSRFFDQDSRYVCRRVYGRTRRVRFFSFRAMPSRPTTDAVRHFDANDRCCAFTRDYSPSITHLAVDPVDLPILILELAAHVDRHIPQVADHRVHLAHVILHLPLARIVCDLGDVTGLRPETVAVVHHPLRLVVHDLAVVVALPRALVLLEAGTSAKTREIVAQATRLNPVPQLTLIGV